VALLEKRGFLYNHSGDFPQVILIVPSHVPNSPKPNFFGFLGLVPKSPIHIGLILAKIPRPNISRLGPFNVWFRFMYSQK
jgi:hypothetical protein